MSMGICMGMCTVHGYGACMVYGMGRVHDMGRELSFYLIWHMDLEC